MINVVVLCGNVGRDPDRKRAGDHTKATFSLALTHGSADSRRTTWVLCEAWDQLAELVCEHVRKGAKVTIQGELRENVWDADGETKRMLYVVCRSVQWPPTAAKKGKPEGKQGGRDDDIPF